MAEVKSPVFQTDRAALSLTPVSVESEQIPENHPTRVLERHFLDAKSELHGNQLPSYDSIARRCPEEVLECSLLLEPAATHPLVDFFIRKKGKHQPGQNPEDVANWVNYSDSISKDFLSERLIELLACIALRQHRLSVALSARKSTLNVKFYRGVFPVFLDDVQMSAAILLVAPVYWEM